MGFYGEDGQLYDTWDQMRGANNRFRQQKETNELLRKQNELKERELLNNKGHCSYKIEDESSTKNSCIKIKLDNSDINIDVDSETRFRRHYKEHVENLKYIVSNKINNEIKKLNTINAKSNLIKKNEEIIKLCNKENKKLLNQIKIYNECIKVLDDETIKEKVRINNVEDMLVQIDLELYGILFGRDELTSDECRLLIKNKTDVANNVVNENDEKISYSKYMLLLLNSKYTKMSEYLNQSQYDCDIDYNKLYDEKLLYDKNIENKLDIEKEELNKECRRFIKLKNEIKELKDTDEFDKLEKTIKKFNFEFSENELEDIRNNTHNDKTFYYNIMHFINNRIKNINNKETNINSIKLLYNIIYLIPLIILISINMYTFITKGSEAILSISLILSLMYGSIGYIVLKSKKTNKEIELSESNINKYDIEKEDIDINFVNKLYNLYGELYKTEDIIKLLYERYKNKEQQYLGDYYVDELFTDYSKEELEECLNDIIFRLDNSKTIDDFVANFNLNNFEDNDEETVNRILVRYNRKSNIFNNLDKLVVNRYKEDYYSYIAKINTIEQIKDTTSDIANSLF